ncbi:MAG: hypothetical protein ACOZNI_18890 [Myxococcota bacterium]
MRKFLSALLAALVLAPAAWAGSTASHTVTVTAAAINEVSITGGNVSLTINSATAGSGPASVSDSTTADLNWSTNEATKKITVATSLATVRFPLTVAAASVSGGTGAGTVTLSTTAQDFVTGISTTDGTCGLSYEASATSAAGTGTDTHTVTYTITAG